MESRPTHSFRASLFVTSPREYTTTTRRSRINPSRPFLEWELRGLGHAVGSRDPTPPFLLRGSYAAVGARARRSARSRPVLRPLIPGRRRRRRETALTPLRSSSSFISDDAQGRRETAGLSPPPPSSWIGSSTIREDSGAASRARSSRANTSNDRSYARARYGARASSLWLLKRPSARRGPGIVSVDRNVRSKCRCSCVLQFTS